MNERGFFTIIGLVMLIISAIFIKGINEFETNYSNGAAVFQLESELQNIADSALIKAMDNLPEDYESGKLFEISVGEFKTSERVKNLNVSVRGICCDVFEKKDRYVSEMNLPIAYRKKKGTILLSVASCDNFYFNEKSYRRSLAYIFDGENGKILNFVNEFSINESVKERLN